MPSARSGSSPFWAAPARHATHQASPHIFFPTDRPGGQGQAPAHRRVCWKHKKRCRVSKPNTALTKSTRTHGLTIPPLKKHAELDIISPWCNPKITVPSAVITCTGPWGVTSTLRPAAIYVSAPILTDTPQNCKAISTRYCKNAPVRLRERTGVFFMLVTGLLCFPECSPVPRISSDFLSVATTCCDFRKYCPSRFFVPFLIHFTDLLSFVLCLNLTADFLPRNAKKYPAVKYSLSVFLMRKTDKLKFSGRLRCRPKQKSSRFLLHLQNKLKKQGQRCLFSPFFRSV